MSTLRTPVCEICGHTGAISAADWLTGAEQVITAGWDRLAMLHDVETGSTLNTLSGLLAVIRVNVRSHFSLLKT